MRKNNFYFFSRSLSTPCRYFPYNNIHECTQNVLKMKIDIKFYCIDESDLGHIKHTHLDDLEFHCFRANQLTAFTPSIAYMDFAKYTIIFHLNRYNKNASIEAAS